MENVAPQSDEESFARYIEELQSAQPMIRYFAAEALGNTRDARAVAPLIQTLCDRERGVRMAAAEALGKIGDPRAVDPLLRALDDASVAVQWAAAEALGNIGDRRAVEPILAHFARWPLPWSGIRALGKLGDVRALVTLITALHDGHASAATALMRLQDERAVDPLLAALDSSRWEVRYYAARALGVLCVERAIPRLEQMVQDDPELRCRKRAALAIRRIKS